MAVKTITITERAYKTLKTSKSEKESFSEAIIRLAEGRTDLNKFFGMIKDEESLKEAREKIRKIREKSSRDLEERRHVYS